MKVFVAIITEDGCNPRVGGVFDTEEKAERYAKQQEEDWSAEWYVEEWEVG